jgi:hypothetical protein
VGLPKRRGTIAAGSVRRELLRPVARRSRRRRGHRHRSGGWRSWRRRRRRGRSRRRWSGRGCHGALRRPRPRLAGDYVARRRSRGSFRSLDVRFEPRLADALRLGLSRDELRQAHIRGQRRRLRRPQEAGQRLQREQGEGGDSRHLRDPGPPNSNSAHPYLRHGGRRLSPLRRGSGPLRCPESGRRPSRRGCGRR